MWRGSRQRDTWEAQQTSPKRLELAVEVAPDFLFCTNSCTDNGRLGGMCMWAGYELNECICSRHMSTKRQNYLSKWIIMKFVLVI